MSSLKDRRKTERNWGALDVPSDSIPPYRLSKSIEYPSCPECHNPGLLTRKCQNSDDFRCVLCSAEFPVEEWITADDLPRPIKDDFVACVIGNNSIEDQAKCRGVSSEIIRSNLRKAYELLSYDCLAMDEYEFVAAADKS